MLLFALPALQHELLFFNVCRVENLKISSACYPLGNLPIAKAYESAEGLQLWSELRLRSRVPLEAAASV